MRWARKAGVFAVLGAWMLLSTCRLDDLVTPPPAATLTFSPVQLADSAAHGSTALRVSSFEIGVSGTGTLSWTATSVGGSAWLGLSSASGNAPGTVTVTFNPAGLDVGVHQDTLLVTASSVSDPTRLPVRFTVFPCVVTPVEFGTPVADSLTTADCSAPSRPERFAKVYRITGSGGDSVSVSLDATGFNGFIVLDSTAGTGAPPLAQADSCNDVEGDPCLRYLMLPRPGTYRIEATTVAPGATGSFILNVTQPGPPNAPVNLTQLRQDSISTLGRGAIIPEPVVVLAAVPSDPDAGDQVRLEAEVRPLDVGFSNTPTHIGAFGPQDVTSFVRIDELESHTSYRWQLRVMDETGRTGPWMAFGVNAADTDFRISVPHAPEPPAELRQLKSNGTTAITAGGMTDEATVVFRALLADPDPDDEIQLEVEVRPVDQAFTGVPTAASIFVSSGQTASASVTALLDDTDYRWRARATDRAGLSSEWVAFGGAGPGGRDFRVQIPATNLGFVAQPTDAFVGALIDPPVQVAARDASGLVNTAYSGVITVEITPGTGTTGAVLLGTVSQTAVSGIATFHNVSVDRAGTGYRLSASAPGLVGATSAAFDVEAIAVHVVLATPPSASGRSGVPLEQQPVVQLETVDDGTPVEEEGIVVTATIGFGPEGASLSGASAVTDASGRATFEALTITGPVGGYVLEFRAPSKGVAVSDTIALEAAPAARLAMVTQPSGIAQAGVVFPTQPAVRVTDGFGNSVADAGLTVTAEIASGPAGALEGGTAVITDLDGVAAFADVAIGGPVGTYTLRFVSDGLESVTSDAIELGPGPAATITMLAGDGQTATAGTSVEIPPAVLVTDQHDNPVPGVPVTFTVTAGGGAVNPTTPVISDAFGVAAVTSWTLGMEAGVNTLEAAAEGLIGSPVTFTATGEAGSAGQLAIVLQPSSTVVVGEPFAQQPVLQLQDTLGNPVLTAGVMVSAAIQSGPGGGSLGGTTTVATQLGLATFTDLHISGTAGTYRLRFTADLVTGATSDEILVEPGEGETIAVHDGNNQSATVATAVAVPPSVLVTDQFGNPVGGVAVAFAVTTDGGGATDTETVTSGSGIAAVGSWTLGTVAGTNTLTATSAGLSGSPVTFTATGTAGAPDTLRAVSSTTPSGTVGEAVDPSPTVIVVDQFGNPVAGETVTFTPEPGAGEVSVESTETGETGQASVTWTLGTTPGEHVLNVTSGSLGPVTFTATASPGDLAGFLVEAAGGGPIGSQIAGQPFDIRVTALDEFENTVTSFEGTVDISSTGTLGEGAGITAAFGAGVLEPHPVTITNIGQVTVTATNTGGAESGTSHNFTVDPGEADAALTTAVVPDGTATLATVVTITVRDALGNVRTAGGDAALLAASVTDGPNAGATFTDVQDSGGGEYTTSYTPSNTGTDEIVVTLDGEPIFGSPFTSIVSPAPGEAATTTVLTSSANPSASGQSVTFTATVTSEAGTPTGNVQFRRDGALQGNISLVDGVATMVMSDLAIGTRRITARYLGIVDLFAQSADTLDQVVQAAPTHLAVTQQPQGGASGELLVQQPVVEIRDGGGTRVTADNATQVTVEIVSGVGGELGGTRTPTAAAGLVEFSDLTLAGTAGEEYVLRFTADPALTSVNADLVTVTAGAAARLAFAAEPQNTVVGETMPPVTVQVQDGSGNPVAATGIAVNLTLSSGSGTLSGTLQQLTDAAGLATFADLSIDEMTTKQLTASADDLTDAVSAEFSITAGAAAEVTLTGPASVVAGVASDDFTLTVRDAQGHPTEVSETTTLTLATDQEPGTATFVPVSPITIAEGAGSATFAYTNTRVGTGTHTITAAFESGDAGLTDAEVSAAITVTSAAAAQLVFGLQPQNAVAGATLDPVTVRIEDGFGNLRTDATDAVTLVLSDPQDATLSGTVVDVAAVDGVAVFDDLSVDQAGTYTLTAASGVLTEVVSAEFTITAGALSLVAAPTTTASITNP